MITAVLGQNIKGDSFSQDLGEKTIFLGPNGSGKSARMQAVVLALMGYIPGGKKTNADILGNYGSSDSMAVGVAVKQVSFARQFKRDGKTVSQKYSVAKKPCSEEDFHKMLGELGSPVAIDIGAFMGLSDQKKIDAICSLYPPGDDIDIAKTIEDIDASKAKVNNLTAKAKSTEDAAARLTTAKAEIKLPAGTLMDVAAKITEHEETLIRLRQDLKDLELEEARVEAEAKVKKEAAEEKEKAKIEEPKPETSALRPVSEIPASGARLSFFPDPVQPHSEPAAVNLTASIKAILEALTGAGCSACAARLVCVRELRKIEGRA
jgi:energy-coupling factor transporter ATP-binding protein EcfA2